MLGDNSFTDDGRTPLLCSRSPVLGAAATRDEESCVKLLAPLPSDRRPNPPDHFGMLIEAQKLRFPFRGFLLDTGRSLTRTCSILCFVLYLIYEAGVVNLCIVSRLPSIYLLKGYNKKSPMKNLLILSLNATVSGKSGKYRGLQRPQDLNWQPRDSHQCTSGMIILAPGY